MTTQGQPARLRILARRMMERKCVLCEDSTDFTKTLHLKEHNICHDCIREYVRIKMDEGVLHIPCPILDCDVLLEYDEFKSDITEAQFLR